MSDSADPLVVVISTPWCGYCHRLKSMLESSGIKYDEVDIEQDDAAAAFVGSVNNGDHVVPTLKFSDGSTLSNPGLAEVRNQLTLLTT